MVGNLNWHVVHKDMVSKSNTHTRGSTYIFIWIRNSKDLKICPRGTTGANVLYFGIVLLHIRYNINFVLI